MKVTIKLITDTTDPENEPETLSNEAHSSGNNPQAHDPHCVGASDQRGNCQTPEGAD